MKARRSVVLLVAVALSGTLASCTDRKEANSATPEQGRGSLYVSLGGDDAYGGRSGLLTAWPQVLFRTRLPITTEFVNLADRREGISDVRRRQVEPARELQPDLVTITVTDDAERGTDPAVFEADLDAVVRRLRDGTTTRVLIASVLPDAGAPEVVVQLNAAVERIAADAGATVVDLSGISATDPTVRGREIAAAFARTIAAPR